jgi:ABC-type glycerol-3-phosphate transport system substrate-binding protein
MLVELMAPCINADLGCLLAPIKIKTPINRKEIVMKRILVLLIVLSMFVGTVACGIGGDDGDVTLVLAMIGDGLMKDRLDELLLEFTEETGVAVETFFIAGSWEEYVMSLQTMIGGGEQLDAAILAIEGVEMFLGMGLALPIDDFIAANPDVANQIYADTNPNLTVPFSRDGQTFAFPFSWNNVVMHINLNRLEEAGLDLPPSNWDRATFMQYMEALTVEADGTTQFAIAVPAPGGYFMQEAWLFNNGAQYMSDDFTTSLINSPEAVEVFQLWQDLIHVYGFAPIPEPGVNQIQQVIQGQVAMGSWGRWPTTAYLAAGFYDVAIQWLPNFRQNMPIFGVDGIFVISNTDHPEEAIALAAWMSDREFQSAYLSDGNIPASRSLSQETISATGIPYNYQLFFEDVGMMRAVSSPPQFAQVALIVERASSEILINNADVQTTLNNAAEEMNAVLAANR